MPPTQIPSPVPPPASVEPTPMTPPGFGPPSHQQPTRDPLDPTRTTTAVSPTGPTAPGPDPAGAGGDRGSSTPKTPAAGPSPAFTPDQIFTPDPGTFEGVIATAVGLASLGVSHRLSPDTNTWLASEAQAHDIAAPLSRIAARHVKLSDKGMANDLSDGLEAGMATAAWIITSHQRTVEERRTAAAWPEPSPGARSDGQGDPR